MPFCWESLAAWGEGDAAGNENYYSTRVFRNPLEVTRANHRSAARYEVGWYRRDRRDSQHPAWQGKRVILTDRRGGFLHGLLVQRQTSRPSRRRLHAL